MIVVLDHEDSFVFTIARYLIELGGRAEVIPASTASVASIVAMKPERIILSPGPRTPDQCRGSLEIIRQLGPRMPILGVCLGHQCIAAAYGGEVQRTPHLMHGRTSPISHDRRGIFEGVPSPFTAARYHSLAVCEARLPDCLEVSARSDDGAVMGIRHRNFHVEGVQFHPESVLTEWGYLLLANFAGVPAITASSGADSIRREAAIGNATGRAAG
jgi:anthranilate synthase/aminodeoxychorismate synthase-like glutamine amidotransferase